MKVWISLTPKYELVDYREEVWLFLGTLLNMVRSVLLGVFKEGMRGEGRSTLADCVDG